MRMTQIGRIKRIIMAKRTLFISLCLPVFFSACGNKKSPSTLIAPGTTLVKSDSSLNNNSSIQSMKPVVKDKSVFRLNFTSVGLGSNFTSMQPVFNVEGNKFIYTSEQTGYYEGAETRKPDTIYQGKFRKSSVDSIMHLVSGIKDTLIYRTNIHVSSGSIQYITIYKDEFHLEFDLHNASDPTAQRIVNILNNYIPEEERKLWLWDSDK